MSDDYTPTIDEMREGYIHLTLNPVADAKEFDRGLAAHDKEMLDKIERVRALADMWASEVSSDEQDYITAAKYRGVARDIYEALEEN